jgi:acyl transferase domain-containing protein
MESLPGSDTGVYVGVFNKDYERIIMRDPENVPFYHATGCGEAVLSNRISYFFDLKGPSMTLDTGCSGSLVALHQACQSIRAGECRQAIVGGTNLMLDPEMMTTMSNLKYEERDILSMGP